MLVVYRLFFFNRFIKILSLLFAQCPLKKKKVKKTGENKPRERESLTSNKSSIAERESYQLSVERGDTPLRPTSRYKVSLGVARALSRGAKSWKASARAGGGGAQKFFYIVCCLFFFSISTTRNNNNYIQNDKWQQIFLFIVFQNKKYNYIVVNIIIII